MLGVSPETVAEDIKNTFHQVGVGEVVDLRKELLDPRRLPGVTNGTWLVRVRILDADKNIPPYIIRREEGELWSLNFEGRRFVCWKCGSSEHIGDKCKDQERTFEEVFGDGVEDSPHSWAAVVKGNSGLGEDLRAKRDAMAKQIKDGNEVKAREKKEAEEKRKAELMEIEKKKEKVDLERQEALAKGRESGQCIAKDTEEVFGDTLDDVRSERNDHPNHEVSVIHEISLPTLLPRAGEVVGAGGDEVDHGGGEVPVEPDGTGLGVLGDRGQGTEPRLVLDRIDPVLLGVNGASQPISTETSGRAFTLDSSLEFVFGSGATRLAIEFEGMAKVESVHNMSDEYSAGRTSLPASSTPGRESQAKKRLRGGNGEEDSFGDLSSIACEGDLAGEDSDEDLAGEFKKQKVGSSDRGTSDEEIVTDDRELGHQHAVEPVDTQVVPEADQESLPGVGQEPEQVPDETC